jgi:hypothetical protein
MPRYEPRLLAEALDAVADAAEHLSELPHTSSAPAHNPGGTGNDKLWTVADVAKFVGATESWVRHAEAVGRLPGIRIGGLLRFHPDAIRGQVRGESPSGNSATIIPRSVRRGAAKAKPGRVPNREGER